MRTAKNKISDNSFLENPSPLVWVKQLFNLTLYLSNLYSPRTRSCWLQRVSPSWCLVRATHFPWSSALTFVSLSDQPRDLKTHKRPIFEILVTLVPQEIMLSIIWRPGQSLLPSWHKPWSSSMPESPSLAGLTAKRKITSSGMSLSMWQDSCRYNTFYSIIRKDHIQGFFYGYVFSPQLKLGTFHY